MFVDSISTRAEVVRLDDTSVSVKWKYFLEVAVVADKKWWKKVVWTNTKEMHSHFYLEFFLRIPQKPDGVLLSAD